MFVLEAIHVFAKALTRAVAAVIIGTFLYVSIRKIKPSVEVRIAFVVIEYSAIISFVALALVHEAAGSGGASLPSLSDFSSGVGGLDG